MSTASRDGTRKQRSGADGPRYEVHESFEQPGAEAVYAPGPGDEEAFAGGHLPDEVTREYARRMHYAAYRMARAADAGERQRWRGAYLGWRDRVVLGNRNLIYRAVQRWTPPA